MKRQVMIIADHGYSGVDEWLKKSDIKRILLVHGKSAKRFELFRYLKEDAVCRGLGYVEFSDFEPNPDYVSALKGLKEFENKRCDAIIAIGGGSAIDVAKCIRVFHMDREPGRVPFMAVPTTAGTGSESTQFAVIYKNGVKKSVDDIRCLPDAALLDSSTLDFLPLYHRKATMLDALCHAIESWWSVTSNDESRKYSREAIEGILANKDGYLSNTDVGNRGMLIAANAAGRAINITRTTAGHAMCYKITGLFGCAHGHAAALCVRVLFEWMSREYSAHHELRTKLDGIAGAMGCNRAEEGAALFNEIFSSLKMDIPYADIMQLNELTVSVDPNRLGNHPVSLNNDTIRMLYQRILRQERSL